MNIKADKINNLLNIMMHCMKYYSNLYILMQNNKISLMHDNYKICMICVKYELKLYVLRKQISILFINNKYISLTM